MEPITLEFHLSAEAAIKARFDQRGDYALEVWPSQLDADQLDVLQCLIGKRIRPNLVFTALRRSAHGQTIECSVPPALPLTPVEVPDWLRLIDLDIAARIKTVDEDWVKNKAEKKALLEETLKRELAESCTIYDLHRAKEALSFHWGLPATMQSELEREEPELMAAIDARRERLEVLIAERKAADERARQQEQDAKTKISQARSQQVVEWLMDHGSDAQKKLHARGLLPEKDILGMMCDQVFAPLEHLERFHPFSEEDIRRGLDLHDGADVATCERVADSGTEADLARLEEIEAAFPEATVSLMEHVGYAANADDTDDPEISRYFIEVSLTVGHLVHARRYMAG